MPAPLVVLIAIVAAVVTDIPRTVFVCAALAAASLALLLPRCCRGAACIASLACLSAAHSAVARDVILSPPLSTALAVVLDDRAAPPVWLNGELLEDATIDGDGVRLAIAVTAARFDGQAPWRRVAGRAQVGVGGAAAIASAGEWRRGRAVRAPVLVRRPQIWRNPGSASERWQRLKRGVDLSGSVKSAALVEVDVGPRLEEWGGVVRAVVRRRVAAAIGAYSPETAAVVTAILIGDRSGLDDTTVRRLQMAGTYHVIAISGGNIAIVVIACAACCRSVLRSRRATALITLVVVLLYGHLVGDQVSVSRAVTAAAVVLLLQIVGWCAPTLRVFLLAALVVALVDPLAVIDVSAWLSFGATLGILLFAGPLAARLAPRRGRVVSAAAMMLAATVAAELMLAPISAAVFARLSVAGLLLNFVAIPAMTVAQLAGTAVVIIGSAMPAATTVFAGAAHAGAWALIRSAALMEIAPWLSWQTPPVHWGWTVAYYGGLLAGVALAARAWRRAGRAVAAGALLVIATGPMIGRTPSEGRLRIAMLDVGQGQAMAIQFPGGRSLLLDAGGSGTTFDIGARVVEPALWALGIRRLDWLAVTHGDVDHAGGAASVLRDLRPHEVWEGIPVPRDMRMQSLRAAAHEAGAVWRRLQSGHTFEVGSAEVEILNPPVPDWERRDNRNDDSLVVRVRFGDVAFLLTGDIERAAEASLALDRSARLRLLSAPHHGSRTSSTPPLVRGWLPHLVMVSAGRGNSFGHPAPEVVARYERLGVDVVRTDLEGAVIVETDGRGVDVRTVSGRRLRLSSAEIGRGGQ